MKLSHVLNLAAVAVGLALSTQALARDIPKPFQGTFEDKAKGAKLELTKKEIKLTLPGGRLVYAYREDLELKPLLEMKSKLYIGDDNNPDKVRDVYIVYAWPHTRKDEAGLSWYNAEIAYFEVNEKTKDPVQVIPLSYNMQGMVMIDSATKRYEIGVAGDQTDFQFVRVGRAP